MTPRQLKAAMDAAGLDRPALAARLGVSVRTIYRWLTGDTVPSPAFAALIRERVPEAKGTKDKT